MNAGNLNRVISAEQSSDQCSDECR
jgi:hypothetical protein